MIANYRFWNKIPNCGDTITAYILRDVLRMTPVSVTSDQDHLLATGSIFFMSNAQSVVWGSGVMRPDIDLKNLKTENIRAVRGHKSHAAIKALRPELGPIPLGDPGILVDYLVANPSFANLPVKWRAAIVPHHRSIDRLKFELPADVCVVDMRDSSLRPLQQIQQSEVVISQSLHGLIFASALGKPYVWISEKDDERWCFKFEDWFSTVDNPQKAPVTIDSSLNEMMAAADWRPHSIDKGALLAAFPRAEVCVPNDRAILDFTTCRTMPVTVIHTDWIDQLERVAGEQPKVCAQFTRTLRTQVRKYFADWSEQPYTLLMPSDARMPQINLADAAALMTHHPGIDALTVVATRDVAESKGLKRNRKLSTHKLNVYPGAVYEGSGLLIRPSVPFSFDGSIYTVSPARL